MPANRTHNVTTPRRTPRRQQIAERASRAIYATMDQLDRLFAPRLVSSREPARVALRRRRKMNGR